MVEKNQHSVQTASTEERCKFDVIKNEFSYRTVI